MSDPYLDPHSGILRNKFGFSDQASLDRAEADAVAVRSILLQGNPLKGDFDSQHLKQIHEYLFQDVYEWAGNDILPDHKNPKGMGGAWRDDHPNNIQATHWWCNSDKGQRS